MRVYGKSNALFKKFLVIDNHVDATFTLSRCNLFFWYSKETFLLNISYPGSPIILEGLRLTNLRHPCAKTVRVSWVWILIAYTWRILSGDEDTSWSCFSFRNSSSWWWTFTWTRFTLQYCPLQAYLTVYCSSMPRRRLPRTFSRPQIQWLLSISAPLTLNFVDICFS